MHLVSGNKLGSDFAAGHGEGRAIVVGELNFFDDTLVVSGVNTLKLLSLSSLLLLATNRLDILRPTAFKQNLQVKPGLRQGFEPYTLTFDYSQTLKPIFFRITFI